MKKKFLHPLLLFLLFSLSSLGQNLADLVEQNEKAVFLITTSDKYSYVKENVVGQTSIEDCRHIAIATLNNADILASWNFKHIVNVSRIRGYNAVNYKHGHKILEIRTPREILTYEN